MVNVHNSYYKDKDRVYVLGNIASRILEIAPSHWMDITRIWVKADATIKFKATCSATSYGYSVNPISNIIARLIDMCGRFDLTLVSIKFNKPDDITVVVKQ